MNRNTFLIISVVALLVAVPTYYFLKDSPSNSLKLPPEQMAKTSKTEEVAEEMEELEQETEVVELKEITAKEREELSEKYKELPDYRDLQYDEEGIVVKRKKLQKIAESFQKETMKKIESLSNREDLSPEDMMNMVYKDDPSTYSEDKKFYLDEIAKPLMDNEEGMESDMDLGKILSKAYDLLEQAAPDELKMATASFQKIPSDVRSKINPELKQIHRNLATKSGDELRDLYQDIQNGRSDIIPGFDKILEKAEGHQNEVFLHVQNSIKINSISK